MKIFIITFPPGSAGTALHRRHLCHDWLVRGRLAHLDLALEFEEGRALFFYRRDQEAQWLDQLPLPKGATRLKCDAADLQPGPAPTGEDCPPRP